MQEVRINRRRALKAAAVAGLPLFSVATTRADDKKPKPPAPVIAEPLIGISTLGFQNHSNALLAKDLAQQNIKTVQLFLNQTDSRYWNYNGRSDISAMTAERCRAIADDYRSADVSIHSMGVYTNLIHPKQSERDANLAYFEAMMKVARNMGVDTLITEAGHYHADDYNPSVAHHFQEKVWSQMVATGKCLAELARRHQVTVLVEPYFAGFLASAKRTRLFLEAVDSPHVRALLDPANLLEINDLDEMFAQLAPWMDCIHAKDRKLHVSQGVPAGQGDLDYPKFIALAAKHTPKAPLIMEYVGADDYKQTLAHLRKVVSDSRG